MRSSYRPLPGSGPPPRGLFVDRWGTLLELPKQGFLARFDPDRLIPGALDALFLPGLIGEIAKVESTCPVTGEAIYLTVTPEGVAEYSPPGAVLSITVPGISCCTDDSSSTDQVGPQSEACSHMVFFASGEAAAEWQKEHPGVAILRVEDAFRLANVNWIERNKKASAAE